MAGAAIDGLPLFDLGGGARGYFESKIIEINELSAIAANSFGGGVSLYGFKELDALKELARVLAPGAPLLFSLYRNEPYDRKDIDPAITALELFDRAKIRVESRRPYPFERPVHRLFVTVSKLSLRTPSSPPR